MSAAESAPQDPGAPEAGQAPSEALSAAWDALERAEQRGHAARMYAALEWPDTPGRQPNPH